MRYITLGDTFDMKFTTRKFSTGAPFALAGTPVVSAYPDNSTTQLTAGITLTVDFDSVTGLNNVRVVASGGNGYAAGNWALVITTGTVDGVSVVGEVIENFVIGAVPSDLRQMGGGAQSATDLKDFADDGYDPSTNKVQGVVLTDTVTTYTGNTPQTGDSFARLGAPAGASVSADVAAVNAKTTNLPSDPADQSLIIAATDAVMTRLGAPVGADLSADIAAVKGDTVDIEADTQDIQSRLPAALVSGRMDSSLAAAGLAADAVDEIWDEVMEGTTTARQSQRLANAANGAKLSGAATTNVKIRDLADSKDRVDATVDADGNRTAVTLDLT